MMVSRKVVLIALIVLLLLTGIAVGLYFLIIHLTADEVCEVTTVSGVVRGKVVSSPQGKEVEQYLGIPYAKPPTGHFRFADPRPVGKFKHEPLDAFDYGDSCMQELDNYFGDFEGAQMWNPTNKISENCLTLNIWVPKEREGTLPVLVHIPGGGFYMGSSQLSMYDGKTLAAQGDIIVASLNYRVGVFGFLSTGDGRIAGNFGLKDQQMALRWLKVNIRAFGGDPGVITLSGESAGAVSVGYHLLSNTSNQLFRRAIMQSGTPNAHWAFKTQQNAGLAAAEFIKKTGCRFGDNRLADCLRTIPAENILNDQKAEGMAGLSFTWLPTIDGIFLTKPPADLIKEGRFQPKDTLITLEANEGNPFLAYLLPDFTFDGDFLHNYTMFLNALDLLNSDLPPSTRRRIKTAYAPANIQDFTANRDALEKALGDRSFTCPARAVAQKFATTSSRTYVGLFSLQASTDPWPKWMGAKHGDCLQWIFGRPLDDYHGYTEKEVEYSKTVISYWANFVRFGDPNGSGLAGWRMFSANGRLLDLRGAGNFVQAISLRDTLCQLWESVDNY